MWLKSVKDGRYYPHVPLKSVLTCILAGLVCRLKSLNQIEGHTKAGVFDRLLGRLPRPSADTLGYALARIDIEGLERYLWDIVQKARRNKVPLGMIDGLRVAAVDGTEVYFTTSDRMKCPTCSRRGSVLRACGCSLVCWNPAGYRNTKDKKGQR